MDQTIDQGVPPPQATWGGAAQFAPARLRPLKKASMYRKDGNLVWNDGGFSVSGKVLPKSGIRLACIIGGFFILGPLGLLLGFLISEAALLRDMSASIPWAQVTAFGEWPKKGLVAFEFANSPDMSPVTVKGPIAQPFLQELRLRVPDREVQVTGAGDTQMLIVALALLVAIVAIVTIAILAN